MYFDPFENKNLVTRIHVFVIFPGLLVHRPSRLLSLDLEIRETLTRSLLQESVRRAMSDLEFSGKTVCMAEVIEYLKASDELACLRCDEEIVHWPEHVDRVDLLCEPVCSLDFDSWFSLISAHAHEWW